MYNCSILAGWNFLFWRTTLTTLRLNPTTDAIQLDPASAAWLTIINRNSGKQRPCAVPKKYFDVLHAWGYVEGTFAAAKLSPTGRARLLEEEMQAKANKKSKKKNK